MTSHDRPATEQECAESNVLPFRTAALRPKTEADARAQAGALAQNVPFDGDDDDPGPAAA